MPECKKGRHWRPFLFVFFMVSFVVFCAVNPDISSGRGIMAADWARQIGLDRRSQ